MALYRTEAIILRTRNLGEADRIVTIYTREHGKRSAAARGSRRPRSRLLSLVQPFSYSRLLVFEGKSLDTLSQGELIHSFSALRDDLLAMAYASYVCELIDQLVEEGGEASQALFDLLLRTLYQIEARTGVRLAVRHFEVQLMSLLGYRPELERCLQCRSVPTGTSWFSVAGGGILCNHCVAQDPNARPISPATLQIMRRLLEWGPDRTGVLRPFRETEKELGRLLRSYIDFRLQRELKSLEFLYSIENTQDGKG